MEVDMPFEVPFLKNLTEINPEFRQLYIQVVENLPKTEPDLGIAEVTLLDATQHEYGKNTTMHQLTFADGSKVNLRLRKFRHQGYLRWDTTFTAEHVLIQAGGAAPEIAVVLSEVLAPLIKWTQGSTELKVGHAKSGAVAVFSTTRYDELVQSQELLQISIPWHIASLKRVIPSVDAKMKVWVESVQKKSG
jgi:hypothetical protein